MKTYTITYYAPYTFAKFTCRAPTIEEARKLRDKFNEENGYSIDNREIRSETFK